MVISRFPCFRYANLFEDGCDHSGSVVTVSYRVKTEAASVEAAWMGEFKKNAKHHQEFHFQIKNLNPCQKYEVKVSVGNRDLLFEVGPFYSEKQTLAYLENEENEEFKTENEEAAKSISNANISITDTSATLKIPANQFCAQSIGISLHQGGGRTESCEEMKITHRESSAAAANWNVVAFDNLQPCTNYNVMLDVFLNRRDPLPTIAGDFQKPSVTSFFTLPTTDDLKKDEFVQYNATTKNFSWDFTEFFERPCAGFDFSY